MIAMGGVDNSHSNYVACALYKALGRAWEGNGERDEEKR